MSNQTNSKTQEVESCNDPKKDTSQASLSQIHHFTLISQSTRKSYKGTEHPSKRWGHSVIIHNNSMIIFGGRHSQRSLSNIYTLDFRTLSWSKIDQIGLSPPARDSHSAVLYNNEMIIFGGSGSGCKLNDLWAFNFFEKRWTKKTSYGEHPCKRDGHLTSIIYEKYMVLFGGLNELDEDIKTVHLLDLTNDFWILTKTEGEQMSLRDSQGSTSIKNTVYYFGGQSPNDELYNDMYTANFEINEQDKKYKTIWNKEIPHKDSPLPPERSSHTCVSYKERYIIIIGGEGKRRIPLNDLWIYDTNTKMYSQVSIANNQTFEPRFCHSSILYGDIIAIYGGMQNAETTLDSFVVFEIENIRDNIIDDGSCEKDKQEFHNGNNINNTNMSEVEGKKQNLTEANTNSIQPQVNNNMAEKSTDTNDLGDQYFFTFEEIKKNYLNNLISWSFLKKISEFNQWPIGCIGNFILNSLKDQVESKNIYIDLAESIQNNKNKKINVLSIKDDGRGINCLDFNQIMYSFSQNENKEYNFFQFGISLKTSAMRLADSFLIISKTENEASIGLISIRLQDKIDSDLVLTPVVNYKITDNPNKKYVPKSNFPTESLKLILDEIRFLIPTEEDLYNLLETLKTGTFIYLFDLKKTSDDNYELIISNKNNDILFNTFYEELGDDNTNYIDISLKQYLNFLQLNMSKNVSFYINKAKFVPVNLYYQLHLAGKTANEVTKIAYLKYQKENENDKIDCFYIGGEQYKGILFNSHFIDSVSKDSNSDVEDIKSKDYFNGVLLYRGNTLISRIDQSKFGDLAYFVKKMIKGKDKLFKVNGYIELPEQGFDLMFNGKEIKDLAVFGFLFTKVKSLIKQINKN